MIRDLAEPQPPELPEYDLCIVGSGPSGASLALELEHSGLRVCVVESGAKAPSLWGDALRRTTSAGIHIKAWSRERVIGGASTTWAGLSAPLETIDLQERPEISRAGWPLSREELLPYWRAASERHGFAPLEEYATGGFDRFRTQGDLQPDWQQLAEKVFLAADPPQNFGRKQVQRLYAGEQIDLLTHASVVELEPEPGEQRIRGVRIVAPDGTSVCLRARAFVLATGGIENARLLLLSRGLCDRGLGNEHDQVGRYMMNHPKNYFGVWQLAKPLEEVPYFFGCLKGGFAGYAGLHLPFEVQRERGLLNSYIRLEPLFPWSRDTGVESFVTFVKRSAGLLTFWKRRQKDQVVNLRDYSETGDDSERQNARKGFLGWCGLGFDVLRHLPSVAAYLWFRVVPGQVPKVRLVRLRHFMEMEPCDENRVTLGTAIDANGSPLPHIAHDTTELDRRTMIAVHETLTAEIERLGLGRLPEQLASADPWPIDQDASHHMGTTRMGSDPQTSVVDADLKLHTVDNVFVTGASVFPTSGSANPTYTAVALSIRLAEHLTQTLSKEPT